MLLALSFSGMRLIDPFDIVLANSTGLISCRLFDVQLSIPNVLEFVIDTVVKVNRLKPAYVITNLSRVASRSTSNIPRLAATLVTNIAQLSDFTHAS